MRSLRTILLGVATGCAALMSGCSPWGPERAEILVGTTPPGASCTLSRLGQPIAVAEPTPAIALVDPAAGEITILCRRQGFADAAVTLPPPAAAPGIGLTLSPAPAGYQQRIDIVLQAGSPAPLPLSGR